MSGGLERFIESYGGWATFLGTAAEGETVAIASGVLAHEGYMAFGTAVAAAAAGAFVSDVALFLAGRRWREAGVVRKALSHPGVARVTRVLARNLVLYALTFRFVPGMKTAGAVTLAAMGMRPALFALCAGVSAAAWAGVFVGMGYGLGHLVTRAVGELERIEHALVAPALAGLALWGWVWLRRRRAAAERHA